MQPHIRAFVERAVIFSPCPDCDGTRLNEPRASSKIAGINIADACAMQISDLAEWIRSLDEPAVAPLLAALQQSLDSFVEIGLGYLSLDRPSGTLSGGEAQRTKMIRHLGSALTDVTYVFDEPTIGLHAHDVERMNLLLRQLRDKGNTVLVVEHDPEVIQIADHLVDLGPGAGTHGGEIVYQGDYVGLLDSGTATGKHLDAAPDLKETVREPTGVIPIRRPVCTTSRRVGGRAPRRVGGGHRGGRVRARALSSTAACRGSTRRSPLSTSPRSRAPAAPIRPPTAGSPTPSAAPSPRPTTSSRPSSAPTRKGRARSARGSVSSTPHWGSWTRWSPYATSARGAASSSQSSSTGSGARTSSRCSPCPPRRRPTSSPPTSPPGSFSSVS